MKTAIASRRFRRSDLRLPVRPGERVIGPAGYIDDLARLGLVREVAALEAAPEAKGFPVPVRWRGATVVCIASGPSLVPEDTELVRQWRARGGGKVIVVNSSWRLTPWADAVYAMDARWWDREIEAVRTGCGRDTRFCTTSELAAKRHDLEYVRGRKAAGLGRDVVHQGGNSGYGAINLAYLWGADRIVLLGYDMQLTNGRGHWHADHPGASAKPPTRNWLPRFSALAADLKASGVPVINATRETALECFERRPLAEVLGG